MSSAVVRQIEEIEKHGGLRRVDIANVVNVSRPTVTRWSKGESTPSVDVQTILADLRYVVDRLSDYYKPDEIRMWLYSRQPLLDNHRPFDLIVADRTKEVLTLIQQLDTGAYL